MVWIEYIAKAKPNKGKFIVLENSFVRGVYQLKSQEAVYNYIYWMKIEWIYACEKYI